MGRSNSRSRARQATATDLYLSGLPYREVAKRCHYSGESSARYAIKAELRRRTEGAEQKRQVVSARLEALIAAHWAKATTAGNATAATVVLKALTDLSRLWGLDAAQRHLLVGAGISSEEFAAMASELLATTGVRPLVEAALPALPPGEAAAWLRDGSVVTADDDHDDDGQAWSNIGTALPHYGPPSGPIPSSHPAAENPSERDSEPVAADPEPVETVEAELVEDDDLPCGCGPRPPGQKRIAAVEVLDRNGVPISRSGLARRLGGYDPFRGWQP